MSSSSKNKHQMESVNQYSQLVQKIRDLEYEIKNKREQLENNKQNASETLRVSHVYDNFLNVKCSKEFNHLTITFPIMGESELHNINLKNLSSGLYTLEKCNLPWSVDLDQNRADFKDVDLDSAAVLLKSVQMKNFCQIHRADQVKKFQTHQDTRLKLYHSLDYCLLELTFFLTDVQEDKKYHLTLELNYSPLAVLPDRVHIDSIKEHLSKEKSEEFTAMFVEFKSLDLYIAYKHCFKNTQRYTFYEI